MAIEYVNKGLKSALQQIISSKEKHCKVLIVRGISSYPIGEEIESVITSDKNCTIQYATVPSGDPQSIQLLRTSEKVKAFSPDFIIGCGGGSIMDTAKILRLLASASFSPRQFINSLEMPSEIPGLEKKIPLLLMPTTAGSGAQCTHFSVVYHEKIKFSLATPALLPDYVIADPALIYEAPKNVLASAAMDALSQSVESFWSRGSTPESSLFAQDAIRLMWGSVLDGILERNWKSLAQMVEASHLAGKAINVSKTTAIHALSYKISSEYGVPHGHCVGMLLPKFFELHKRIFESDPRRGEIAVDRQRSIASALGYQEVSDFLKGYQHLMHKLSLSGFDALKIEKKFDAELIVASVNLERLRNHPIPLTALDLMTIFD